MFDGNTFFPDTGMPIRKIACISRPFALAEPVPFTVAMRSAKSFTRLGALVPLPLPVGDRAPDINWLARLAATGSAAADSSPLYPRHGRRTAAAARTGAYPKRLSGTAPHTGRSECTGLRPSPSRARSAAARPTRTAAGADAAL